MSIFPSCPTAFKSHSLNRLEAWAVGSSPVELDKFPPTTNSHIDGFIRMALFANKMGSANECRVDVVTSPTSTTKVGRGSCSSSSTIPQEPSRRSGSLFSTMPGDDAKRGGRLARSELLPLDARDGPDEPRARVTVLMPLSSRVLLNIFAAASELENRAGR